MFEQQLFITVLMATILTASCLVCDDPVEITTGTCAKILKNLEKALLQDEGNLFHLRRAFFHSPTADPVLLKVVYNITYAKNITAASEIQLCSTSAENSSIALQQNNLTLGWTSTGVYVVFHPMVLSMIQAQLPFSILRIIHAIMQQRSPEADTFLWDGFYDLPTLYLNMHVMSLPCIPSKDLFESVLMDFNTLVSDQQFLHCMQNALCGCSCVAT